MKETSILLLLLCGGVLSLNQCCPPGELVRRGGYCGTSLSRISLNCSIGHMLLKDVIVSGTKLSTEDTPDLITVEDPSQYCLGQMYRNASEPGRGTIPVAVACFQEFKSEKTPIEVTGFLTLVSVLFLLVTLAVYMYLPQMRDLQGQCYMCMCISMAIGFLSLGILQLSPGFIITEVCATTGFLVYFWMMATFFWMNVISINVYRTVIDASYLKKTERKQYALYSCYAWGCSVVLLFVALVTNFVEGDHLKPGIGTTACWFQGRTETWVFFYGPIAVLISSNVVLFLLSSVYLWRDTRKYEVNKLNILKHKFLLSLKLFLVMGVSWVFEIASFAHGKSHIIWEIMDIFNCLQGFVIFLILVVLRRRAIQGLVQENCCLPMMRPLASKLSPLDDSDDQHILADDHMEVRLN
ncbi:probable G-protein coupled receptor Mth-like 3 [Choristoneura fumiferana]|uniref:probable G-protein coupled receptor Mth-like 3 n=1 Tax=Choristoneura fumiferana TaxID=7141 RepID=UPI003D154913